MAEVTTITPANAHLFTDGKAAEIVGKTFTDRDEETFTVVSVTGSVAYCDFGDMVITFMVRDFVDGKYTLVN